MEFFSDSPLDDLIAELPDWLRADDPAAELYKWLKAIADAHVQLDAAAEQLYADTSLGTASIDGMLAEHAYVYDLRADLSAGALSNDQVRAYIAAWVGCTGSAQSLTNLLLAIINLDPRNASYGTLLTFPGGGGGLTFPADGSGLTLYQIDVPPTPVGGLVFPIDGSGLTFPDPAVYFAEDGTGLGLPLTFPAFSPLTFPSGGPWVIVTEAFGTYGLTVTIKSWLAFNRGAVLRALDRFRQAHCTPTVYVESPT